jgi:hypothetical protein
MVKENLFMYSSSFHIFSVLFKCNVDIMSLNHYFLYVVEEIITISSSILLYTVFFTIHIKI